MGMSCSISQMLILPTHLNLFKCKTLKCILFKSNFHVIAINLDFPPVSQFTVTAPQDLLNTRPWNTVSENTHIYVPCLQLSIIDSNTIQPLNLDICVAWVK